MADVLFTQADAILFCFYETETKTISYIMHKKTLKILYKTPVYKYIDKKYNKINENDYILI